MARLGLGSAEQQQREPDVFRRPGGSNPFDAIFGGGAGSPSPITRTELPPLGTGRSPFDAAGAPGSDALAAPAPPEAEGFGALFLRSLPALLAGPGAFAANLVSNMRTAEGRGSRFEIGEGHRELVKLVDEGVPPKQAVAQVVRRIGSANPELLAGSVVGDMLEIASGLEGQQAKPPEMRQIQRGDQNVFQQFNAETGQFDDIAGAAGPRFAPPAAGTSIKVENIMPAPMQENIWTKRGMERIGELDQELAQSQRMSLELDAAEAAIDAGAHQEVAGPKIGFATPLGHFGVDLGTDFLTSLLQVGRAVGVVDADRLSQTELLQAVTARMAPMMRPVGSGSTSDRDMELFIQAVPSLAKSAKGNKLIIQLMRKGIAHKQQAMAALEEMLEAGTYTPSAYSRRVSELGRPFSDDELETLEVVAQGKPEQLAPAKRATTAPEKLTVEDIGRMQAREILLTDISKLNPEQRAAVVNRMSALGM